MWATFRWTYNTDMSYADRATINMVHDNTALTISQDVSPAHSSNRVPWRISGMLTRVQSAGSITT